MFCIKCGTSFPKGTNFCPNCGQSAFRVAAAVPTSVAAVGPKKKGQPFSGLLLVAAIIIIVAGSYALQISSGKVRNDILTWVINVFIFIVSVLLIPTIIYLISLGIKKLFNWFFHRNKFKNKTLEKISKFGQRHSIIK
ncbi:MAG: hypothetical protein V1716_03205 [Candidatus Uhrbacteria bacterium]